jgi:hypothetical protein
VELGFAVGNMAGAGTCDAADYKQLEDILLGWQCKMTGDVGRLMLEFTELVGRAQEECAGGSCPPERCVDVWKVFNGLIKEVHPSDLEGHITRGPVPPKVKGPPKIQRARRTLVPPYVPPKKDDNDKKNGVGEGVGVGVGEGGEESRYARPSRGMGYGDAERRERWYPARV